MKRRRRKSRAFSAVDNWMALVCCKGTKDPSVSFFFYHNWIYCFVVSYWWWGFSSPSTRMKRWWEEEVELEYQRDERKGWQSIRSPPHAPFCSGPFLICDNVTGNSAQESSNATILRRYFHSEGSTSPALSLVGGWRVFPWWLSVWRWLLHW